MSDELPALPDAAEALLAEPAALDDSAWNAQLLAVEQRTLHVDIGSTPQDLLDPPAWLDGQGAPPGSEAPVMEDAGTVSSAELSGPLAAAAAAPTAIPSSVRPAESPSKPPPPGTTSLSDLARAVAQKPARAESSALYKESLSVAAAARAHPPAARRPRVREVSRSEPAPSQPQQPSAVAKSNNTIAPFLAGAGVALAAAAVVALLLRGPEPTPAVATATLPPEPIAAHGAGQGPPPAAVPTPAAPSADEAPADPEPLRVEPSEPARSVASGPRAAPQAERGASAARPGSARAQAPRDAAPVAKAPSKPNAPPPPEHIVLEETPESPAAPTAESQLRPASGASPTLPARPSTGAVQAALGSVMSAARACVAGTSGPSTATVVFAASGSVASVTLSGPAAGTPAGSCVQSALGRARVAPFSQTTYVVGGVSVRP